uniref:Secreted RxLR effector protein 120 n=1 Tax=Plasmopara viticola TaxID=143451 RepID=RL120_PLAVT|nr:RecName: Full=Secreted RxLR effector protein 120; Flags: Precursor [Plasmopara viticola]
MRGAYYVITALLVVASSQTSADSGHRLHVYDHDVVAAENAAAKTLPQQSLRGSRDVPDDLAHEERAIISELVEEGAKLIPRAAENVEEMPRVTEAVGKRPRVAEKDALEKASGADEASKKPRNTATDDAFQGMSTEWELELPFKEWNTEIEPMREMPEPKWSWEKRKLVHEAFVKLCAEDLNPTVYETARLWSLFDGKAKSRPATFHRQVLIQLAKENVRRDVLIMKSVESEWDRWNEVSILSRVDVLNMLLNVHFQRWKRMYNAFGEQRSKLIAL